MTDEEIISEAEELRKKIFTENKKHPKEMFFAFCDVLMDGTKREYEEFVKDLELDEKDKINILNGMLDKKVKSFWKDIESIVDFGEKMLDKFNQINKAEKKKRKKK